ncbi:hypothetical protein MBLNU457_1246t1 [Dothideomycetes sp. NU457]
MANTSIYLRTHIPELLVTALLVAYSLARAKLTPIGVLAALLTALIHTLAPTSLPFSLLVLFFLCGTIATRVNHKTKASLTQSSTGGSGGEGPRNAAQVLANSAAASAVILASTFFPQTVTVRSVVIGTAANYAAAAADTLSSELGILSRSAPFLITQPWRRVARGTNGGVTVFGLGAGALGGAVIAAAVGLFERDARLAAGVLIAGICGTVLDSVLGALVQVTVEDKNSGRVIEGANGRRVIVEKGGSRVQRGFDLLNNNGVNFAMTATITVVAMLVMG